MVGKSFPIVIQSTLRDYEGFIVGADLTLTVNFVEPEEEDYEVEVPFDSEYQTDEPTCKLSFAENSIITKDY